MKGQEHLWNFYKNAGENRGNHFRRNSGGQAGGKNCQYAEGFQSVYPRCVEEL
jgi:4-oxalomesaconate hydratase